MNILLICIYFMTTFFFARAQSNQTVTCRDPHIVYQGTWVDQDNGGHKFTVSQGSSFSFQFQGTEIYWFATIDPRGAIGSVVIDNKEPVLVDTSSGASAASWNDTSFPSAVMFAATGLDGSKTHTLNVTYAGVGALGGPYLDIYTLECALTSALPQISSMSSSSVTATGAGNPTPTFASVIHRKLQLGPTIGGVVGGLAAIIFLFVGIFLYRRRRPPPIKVIPKPVEERVNPYIENKRADPYPIVTKESGFRFSVPGSSTPDTPSSSSQFVSPYDVRSQISEAPPIYE